MNGFRLFGDGLHLFALVFLPISLLIKKSSSGVSARSQILSTLVFIARYVDLFTNFVSIYNSTFKILYIFLTLTTVLLILLPFRKTYNADLDRFRGELLLIPALVVALLVNYEFSVIEVLWSFSQYLEVVAMVPQFYMVLKGEHRERNVLLYLAMLGIYRAFYIFNWIYRLEVQGYYDGISMICGSTQTGLFIIFFVTLIFVKPKDAVEKEHLIGDTGFPQSVFTIAVSDQKAKLPQTVVPTISKGSEKALMLHLEGDNDFEPEASKL